MVRIITRFVAPSLVVLALLQTGSKARAASAVSIVQTLDTGTATVPYSTTLAFNAFDTSLGTLTGITIGGTATINANIEILNTSGQPQTFDAMVTVPVTVSSPTGLQTTLTPTASIIGGSVGPGIGPTAFPGMNVTQAYDTINVPASDFGAYMMSPGQADVDLTFTQGVGNFSVTGGAGLYVSGSADGSSSVVLTYEYTPTGPDDGSPVPAPAPVLPIAASMLGAGCITAFRRCRYRA